LSDIGYKLAIDTHREMVAGLNLHTVLTYLKWMNVPFVGKLLCSSSFAYAMAKSNGQGQAFAKASAQSSAISDCFSQSLGFSQANADAQASS
jgi:hypothetical protein